MPVKGSSAPDMGTRGGDLCGYPSVCQCVVQCGVDFYTINRDARGQFLQIASQVSEPHRDADPVNS